MRTSGRGLKRPFLYGIASARRNTRTVSYIARRINALYRGPFVALLDTARPRTAPIAFRKPPYHQLTTKRHERLRGTCCGSPFSCKVSSKYRGDRCSESNAASKSSAVRRLSCSFVGKDQRSPLPLSCLSSPPDNLQESGIMNGFVHNKRRYPPMR